MKRSCQLKSLQKLASVYANVHDNFNLARDLVDRQTYKNRRSATVAEWQILAGYTPALAIRGRSCGDRVALE